MNTSDRILQQRNKEQKALKLFLLCSVVGSLAAHGFAMTMQMGNVWNPEAAAPAEEEMEVVVEDAPVEQSTVDQPTVDQPTVDQPTVDQIAPEPEEPSTTVATVQEVAIASQLAPTPIPLTPESQAPLPTGQDAPSQDTPAPKSDPVSPLTNQTGDTPAQPESSGLVTNPDGKGFGFGFSNLGIGFNLNGKPTGKPDGQPSGQEDGKSGGVPGGQPKGQGGVPTGKAGEITIRTAPPNSDRPKKPVCLDCPKPRFRDSEGSARVTYDIGPDGRVTNVRLRQSSGNPEVDRETLETLSKWRFDPKTIPEGGRQNVRTRFTFEEEGSTYQRQNEQRRQEVQRRQEQPQPQTEPIKPQPATAINEVPAKPAPLPTSPLDAVPKYPQGVEPASQSAPVSPPVEPADQPPPPEPAPALGESPPAPVEAPPLPSEPAPVDVAPPTPTAGDSVP